MDKFSSVKQDSAGNLILGNGSRTVRVTSALSDTLVPIYSSDSLAATKANPFTLPDNGKIECHARNGKIRVKVIDGASEVLVDEIVMNAGYKYGTFASRPAAGSADLLYFATDIGRLSRDNGTTWENYPDFALDAMEWYPAADVVAAATTDVFGGLGNFIEITHASGTVAITALANANALEGSPRLAKFTVSGGTLTLTHNATSLEISDGADLAVTDGMLCWVIGKGGSNVRVHPVRGMATQAEAQALTSASKVMSPARVKDALEAKAVYLEASAALSTAGDNTINIPAGAWSRVELELIGLEAVDDYLPYLRVNADTGGNYDYVTNFSQSGSTSNTVAAAATGIALTKNSALVDETDVTDNPLDLLLTIFDPAGATNRKNISYECPFYRDSAAVLVTGHRSGGRWNSTAAITSLLLTLRNATGASPAGAVVNPSAGKYRVRCYP